MEMKTIDSNRVRNHWRETLDMVKNNDIDVVITRYNHPVAAMLDYEDYLGIRDELARQRRERQQRQRLQGEAIATMLASERVLARDWDTPEEDEAWQDL